MKVLEMGNSDIIRNRTVMEFPCASNGEGYGEVNYYDVMVAEHNNNGIENNNDDYN